MTFASPWFALLFLPLAFAGWRLLRRARRNGIRFSAVRRIPTWAPGWRAVVAAIAPYLLLSGLALLVLAAVRPRTPLGHQHREVDAIAIMMVVDVSGSMSAMDLAPKNVLARLQDWQRQRRRLSGEDERKLQGYTRLAEVKRLFADFVQKRPDDLIGLVSFGSFAETRSPLTADHEALCKLLEEVRIPETDSRTAIGDGLGMALARLEQAVPQSKVVILLSDGANNEGTIMPEQAADIAARRGIKVYAIGVGTRAHYTPFVAQNMFGVRFIDAMEDVFDEGQLKGIAKKTGGRYFGVNDSEGLEDALAEIDRLERTTIDADIRLRWRERYQLPLMGGLALVLLAMSASLLAARRMA